MLTRQQARRNFRFASLGDTQGKVYDRARLEAVLHRQSSPLAEVAIEPRRRHRVSQEEKLRAVESVKGGLTPHHVGKRIGVWHTTVSKWVKEFERSGGIPPARKLDPYRQRIVEMIEEEPSLSILALHKAFRAREKFNVAYSRFSQFIAELGYVRDPQTGRLRRQNGPDLSSPNQARATS
jgi:transposase-like protein